MEKTAGRGCESREPQSLNLYPCETWSKLICEVNASADVPKLLTLLQRADLYLQREVQFAFHQTRVRVWSLKGHRGRRLMEAPGENLKVYDFGLVDWRDGWFDGRIAPGRIADVFCKQVRAAVTRSKARGRVAIIITDNLKTYTAQGSLPQFDRIGLVALNFCASQRSL